MHSLRALPSAFGWRRRAFLLVVLLTLGLFGLVAVVDGTEWITVGHL